MPPPEDLDRVRAALPFLPGQRLGEFVCRRGRNTTAESVRSTPASSAIWRTPERRRPRRPGGSPGPSGYATETGGEATRSAPPSARPCGAPPSRPGAPEPHPATARPAPSRRTPSGRSRSGGPRRRDAGGKRWSPVMISRIRSAPGQPLHGGPDGPRRVDFPRLCGQAVQPRAEVALVRTVRDDDRRGSNGVALDFPAHAARHPMGREQPLGIAACVLTAAIRMVQDPRARLSSRRRALWATARRRRAIRRDGLRPGVRCGRRSPVPKGEGKPCVRMWPYPAW